MLASTGTIVGRVNGFNVHLVTEILPSLMEENLISGGEFMMLNDYYDRTEAVAKEWRSAGIPFPTMHCEKDVGTLLSDAGAQYGAGNRDEAETIAAHALYLYEKNCEVAAMVGSSRMVFHLWGGMNSDAHLSYNVRLLPKLIEMADSYGIRLLIENVPSALMDPLTNWRKLKAHYSKLGLVFDTRFGHVHRQMEDIFADGEVAPHIEHIHISDHRGEKKDFATLRPILHPGEGEVDFDAFARHLACRKYAGTVTLESPVTHPEGADARKLRETLVYLKELLL